MISINPDAHNIDGFNDVHYGCLAAQKGMITSKENLSSLTLEQFEKFLGRSL